MRNLTRTACERYQLDVSDDIGRCVLLSSVLGKMSHAVDWPHSIVVKTLTFWLWDYSQTGSIEGCLSSGKDACGWPQSATTSLSCCLSIRSPQRKHTGGLVSCLWSHIWTSTKSHNSGSPLSASPPAEYRKGRKVQPTVPEKKILMMQPQRIPVKTTVSFGFVLICGSWQPDAVIKQRPLFNTQPSHGGRKVILPDVMVFTYSKY